MFAVTDFPDLPRAKCKHEDPELLMPDLDGTPARLAELVRREAVQVCAGCPEIVRCTAWADSEDYPYGAWGGRWWDGSPTDVALDDAPTPATRVRSTSHGAVA